MLGNMKGIYRNNVKKRVAKDGLGPNCVMRGCSDKLAKAMVIAATMGDDIGKLTNKKLLLTVLSAHYLEGPVPSKLKQFKLDKLDAQALETMEWMKRCIL